MLIEAEDRLKVVGEAPINKFSADAIRKYAPDVIICDLPGAAEDALAQLSVPELRDIPIMVLTRNNNFEFYQHCLKLGIRGLISKEHGVDVLYKAIVKVFEGDFWFDRSIMGETIRHMIDEKQLRDENPAVKKISEMTDRERQVIELICKGMKNKTIAERLFITETTVRHHLTSVFNKLEVGTRLELVIYAFKNQLVKLPINHSTIGANGNGNGNGNGHSNGSNGVKVH